MKKIYCFLFVSLLTICFFSCTEESIENDKPKEKVYVINNAEFGIKSNKTNSRATNDGINAAIKNAKKEGYNVIKLTPGEYLILADGSSGGYTNKGGIFVPSNITLDLTDVKLYIETNSLPHYKILRLDMVENVTIIGGHLIGDKEKHNYVPTHPTHEGGGGIDILCCKNVIIKDMKIQDMTGDAIGLGYGFTGPNERRLNKNIQILNCEMFGCRRQGITILHASDVEIAYCKIHNIGGTPPGCGIDIEPEAGRDNEGNLLYKSWVDHVYIHHNEFRNTKDAGLCIVNRLTSDIEAADNYFDSSSIIVNNNPKRIRFIRNTLMGRSSYMVARSSQDVYMPIEGPSKNILEFGRITNCSEQTGYIKETDNYTKCDQS